MIKERKGPNRNKAQIDIYLGYMLAKRLPFTFIMFQVRQLVGLP